MTINYKNFLTPNKKMSKMGDFQEMKHIEGLEVASVSADLYKSSRDDISLFYFKEGSNHAVAYTTNTIVSESITWNKKNTKKNIKALFVNTKNANTFTGKQGITSLDESAKLLADSLTQREILENGKKSKSIKIEEILFASTGVIGERFPIEKVKNNIQNLVGNLRSNQNKLIWFKSATAIMTTDTKPKMSFREIKIGGKIISISGIAKGSGMIAPNLATMLSFIFTDADISSEVLKLTLDKVIASTFNAITVDSDTSTNDMVAIFSTKKIKIGRINSISSSEIIKFEGALKDVCLDLAKQVVVDGEGASKFLTIKVVNAKNEQSAKKIAFSVANSPLVKTAAAGEDPNWGRILMGIGKSGEKVNINKLIIKIGNYVVAEKGKISETYSEEKLKEYMNWDSILIEIDLNQGKLEYECYTCDFTHDYIDINANYRRS
jgi:glutamate N-acetyltransferase/amino-acid N-acetyltransferase